MRKFFLLFFCVIAANATVFAQTSQRVKIYEGQETIPTYKMGADEISPIFYTGRGVQGAAGHIYPYPEQISLGEKITDETYNMVYLENEYLKVSVLPAFGGKLFAAIDKTNGHELFHRNSNIKPDLIGTLGAWISGGIEWCFPHHHRPTTLLPSDYRLVENADGSATIWVGETERGLGLRGVIGLTLHPGKAYIEANYYLNNGQNVTRNFLFWANVAVTANNDFRTFWPPQQEIGVFHSNNDFVQWPIARESYRGVDYGANGGTDLTWWKNQPSPVSFFFWQGEAGFVGGYDYAQKAGTIHVADVFHNRTSKLWQFGPGLEGQNARRKLTDDGKAYVELMTGTYSNNQPDYSWFSPHSVKEATNFWYPVRDLEIVKNANTEASVTLQMRDNKTVFYGFNTTQLYRGAKAVLKYGDEILSTQTIDIDPAKPFTSTFKSKDDVDEYQLFTELQDANGNILISYTPYKLQHPDLPERQQEVKSPREIESVEDLYLTGRFVEQFSRPGLNPDNYYLEALKKSPDDYRVNIALGIRRVGEWRYVEAEKYLMTAYNKLQVSYFQPKEGELFYYLALAQKGQGKIDAAYRNFFQATWYYEWFSAAYYQLALIESRRGNYAQALAMAQEAYSTNNYDGSIVVLNSALMRRLGQQSEALALINKLLDKDPINFSAIYEKELIEAGGNMAKWQKNMQDVDNNYIDISLTYVKAGLYDDGLRLLSSLQNPKNPLVYYYLAWLYENTGQSAKAKEMLTAATRQSYDYCFPFREETQDVLSNAIEKDPQNAEAFYLIGNLLYDRRPEEAMQTWQKAVAIKNNFPMVWRNLAFGEFHQNRSMDKAIEYQQKAIATDANHPRWYSELESYFDLSGRSYKECLTILEKNKDVVKKDVTAPQKLVKLYNLNGEYDKAIDFLKTHHFRTWEGGTEIHNHYVDALTMKGLELTKKGQYKQAIGLFNEAMLYPENLEVGKPLNDGRAAMLWYFIGQAYEKSGQKSNAKDAYTKSAKAVNGRSQDLDYYKAKAYEALGQSDKANELYSDLIKRGENILERGAARTGIGVEEATVENSSYSQAYLLQAFGNIGLGNTAKAKELFGQALKSYSNNLWAKYYIDSL
jgi:tetratricopeptide (TPR) repeat protein